MLLSVILLIFSAILIYLSCEFFVNGIEWVGKIFNISQNAVGTVLAAIGTALPESVVTLLAVIFGTTAGQKDIGVGAALGGPLVLSTVAYAIVGFSIVFFRRKRNNGKEIDIDSQKLSRDQAWFLIIFFFKVALGFVIFRGKLWTGFLFLLAYLVYFYVEIKSKDIEEKLELEPLKFRPKDLTPSKAWILLQTVLALSLIFLGSQIFVKQLELFSNSLGVKPHLIALLLSPIATELPEILNAVIWVRQGKEILALGNISGAMMIQATVPSALGIIFTPWIFDSYLALAAIITAISIFFLWFILKKNKFSAEKLIFASIFYVIFIVGIFLIKTS